MSVACCGHLWVKLDSQLGLHKDLYICVAYVCPENPTFYDQPCALDTFDELTNDIAGIQQLGGDSLLAGNFNARMGVLPDCLPDHH